MKKLSFFLIPLFLFSCTKSLDFELKQDPKPVFYVYLENGKPAEVFVGETTPSDTFDYNRIDTNRTVIQMFENGSDVGNIFSIENALRIDTNFYGNQIQGIDTLFLYNHGLKYTSNNICNTNTNYSFKLKYKDYPEIEISEKIPIPVTIDSVKMIPNIGYSWGTYAIRHKATIYFKSPDENSHYLVTGKINLADSSDYFIRYGQTPTPSFFINDNQISNENVYTINVEVFLENGAGDFYLTLYLYHISDGMYKQNLYDNNYNEYLQNSTAFDEKKSMQIFTMTQGAYTNIFAYSYNKYYVGLIHVVPPPVK